jgi:hypothetical protein
MPAWKVDLVFEAQGHGWEETYYADFGVGDFGAADAQIRKLADARIALSAPPVQIKAYRITDPLTAGRQGQPIYFKPRLDAPVWPREEGATDPATSINVGFIHNATNRTRRIQMRGIPDVVVSHYGDLRSPEWGTWQTKFNKLRNILLGIVGGQIAGTRYGWLMRPRAKELAGVSYSMADPILPLFTFPAGTFDPETEVDQYKLVRFSRFNGSNSVLNRELVVLVKTATTAAAATPIAAGPQITPGRAIVYGAAEFIAADNVGVERTGRRAPGRPLLVTPGRGRANKRI